MGDGSTQSYDEGRAERNSLSGMLSGVRERVSRVNETVQPRAKELADRGAEAARSARDSARDRLDDGVAAVTQAEWRAEVEAALSDITSVLLAMDARLSALEERDDD